MTVTDANAILGRMDKEHFLGGAMRLYPDKAQAALTSLAQQMRLDPEAAALGIVQVTNANIDRALRRVSVARGHDPRDCTLVAFGGAVFLTSFFAVTTCSFSTPAFPALAVLSV